MVHTPSHRVHTPHKYFFGPNLTSINNQKGAKTWTQRSLLTLHSQSEKYSLSFSLSRQCRSPEGEWQTVTGTTSETSFSATTTTPRRPHSLATYVYGTPSPLPPSAASSSTPSAAAPAPATTTAVKTTTKRTSPQRRDRTPLPPAKNDNNSSSSSRNDGTRIVRSRTRGRRSFPIC